MRLDRVFWDPCPLPCLWEVPQFGIEACEGQNVVLGSRGQWISFLESRGGCSSPWGPGV